MMMMIIIVVTIMIMIMIMIITNIDIKVHARNVVHVNHVDVAQNPILSAEKYQTMTPFV
jgi:hypothetical protein